VNVKVTDAPSFLCHSSAELTIGKSFWSICLAATASLISIIATVPKYGIGRLLRIKACISFSSISTLLGLKIRFKNSSAID